MPDEREVVRVARDELIEDTNRSAWAARNRAKPARRQVHLSWNWRPAGWRRQTYQPRVETVFAGIGIRINWNKWKNRIGRHCAGMYMFEGYNAGHWIELVYVDN